MFTNTVARPLQFWSISGIRCRDHSCSRDFVISLTAPWSFPMKFYRRRKSPASGRDADHQVRQERRNFSSVGSGASYQTATSATRSNSVGYGRLPLIAPAPELSPCRGCKLGSRVKSTSRAKCGRSRRMRAGLAPNVPLTRSVSFHGAWSAFGLHVGSGDESLPVQTLTQNELNRACAPFWEAGKCRSVVARNVPFRPLPESAGAGCV